MPRIVILDVTVPDDVPDTAVLSSCNKGLQANTMLNLDAMEFFVKILGNYLLEKN